MAKITPIGSAAPGKALVYQSATIFERRRRILHEARVMISELGYEKFSIRELARRADVAQRTLYNAFGSRENIVASAIIQYSREFTDHAVFFKAAHTVEGMLERLIKVHSRNLQIPAYNSAIMAVYNSQTLDPTVRRAIRKLATDGILPFAEHLAAGRQLAMHITPESYAENLTNFIYCTLSSWCVGEISNQAMVESIVETFLMVTFASTAGGTKREANVWLVRLRSRSSEWVRLRAESAVPETPRRAPRSAARAS